MRTKHVRPEDGSLQTPSDPISARPTPASVPPWNDAPMPELRLHTRAGSPREPDQDSSICFSATLSMHSDGGEQPASANGLPVGTTLRRYVLLEQVGQGAMGVVYAAYDYALDRKVAVKLLREPRHGSSQRRRLMREAQALAKLSHPNVVAVHDIGSHRDQVFIAMEYVDGRTLRNWRDEEPRSLREVLAVFRAAGEGLAAAHAAGIVHRDFKPDNVLVDRHGRARVSDFGLASVAHEPAEPTTPTEPRPSASDPSVNSDALTRTGMLFGTPAYMALEQHLGKRAIDARADQFSFAVALYESVCGVHPFDADTPAELVDNIRHGRIQKPRRRVPGWLVRALLPALSADPADRYSSMAALLRSLRDRRPLRVAVIAAVIVIAAVGLFVAGGMFATNRSSLFAQASIDSCEDTERALDEVWDRRKSRVHAAFALTGSPFAGEAWAGVERELDRYADKWRRMRTTACAATYAHYTRSMAQLELQIECLDRRSAELRALVDRLLDPNAETIKAAIQAAQSLPALDTCADTTGLEKEIPLPDAAVRAHADELRARNADLRARLALGQVEGALPEGRKLVADAEKLGYRPVHAEALFTLGGLLWAHSEFTAAEDTFTTTVDIAWQGQVPRLAIEALLELSWVVGEEQGQYRYAQRLAMVARRDLADIGGDARLQALLEDTEGVLWLNQRQLAKARPHLELGLELSENVHGPDSHQVSASLEHLGMLAQAEHRLGEAVQLFQRARKIAESVHGFEHSAPLTFLAKEAKALLQAGRYDEAFVANQRGYELLENEDPIGVMFLANLGLLEWERKQYAHARDHLTRALAITEKIHGRDHIYVAEAATDLGRLLEDMSRPADAVAQLARAAEIYERRSGADHPDLATALFHLGRAHLAAGKRVLATPVLERALVIRERTAATAAEIAEVRSLLK